MLEYIHIHIYTLISYIFANLNAKLFLADMHVSAGLVNKPDSVLCSAQKISNEGKKKHPTVNSIERIGFD